MRWRICVDTGGTFTDCWALPPGCPEPVLVKVLSSGRLRVRVKNLRVEIPRGWNVPDGFFTGFQAEVIGQPSILQVTSWENGTIALDQPIPEETALDLFTGEEAPVIGARLLTGTGLISKFPPLELRLATTRGTNALLEGKGAPVTFFVTEGFGDLLEIRDQRRPELFALQHRKPKALYSRVQEIPERLDATGAVLQPMPPFTLPPDCPRLAAVALMHSYANPAHEQRLRETLLQAGFEHVSLSSELAPMIKIVPRAETAVVDACLTPVMSQFLDHVQDAIGAENRMLTMTSAGGLETREAFHPKDSLFSGPAGGVVGAAAAGRALGHARLITFDMGGTSTDVARYDGDFQYQFQQRVANATLLSPSLRIETVASGGGSICRWTEQGLRVGPESAGADPGPACYGRGGPLTITDVNVLLERIEPAHFGIPLGPENLRAAEIRLAELMTAMGLENSESARRETLEGLLAIAVEQMADSIRAISIREGADPAGYALLAFGGAGPLHACDIAERLGMTTILVPAEAGVLSAYGLHCAVQERFAERQILRGLAEAMPDLAGWVGELRDQAAGELAGRGIAETRVRRQLAELRVAGQDATLTVELSDPKHLAAEFRAQYAQIFGYAPPEGKALELVSLRVVVSEPAGEVGLPPAGGTGNRRLNPGDVIEAPAIIQDQFSTLYLKPGWTARVAPNRSLVVEKAGRKEMVGSSFDTAIQRELFRHRFEHLVREMGVMLQRSAISTNVKERADFSCALLDREGKLVVNAPHIPVHLGALGLCIREVAKVLDLGPGDMAITNHPGFGGSHLPDVTVISPVFADGLRLGYVANRAHHAEIGGIRPGSMPPDARSLVEEGVVIPPMLLFRAGQPDYDRMADLLTTAPFPTRNLRDNLADLQAQAAANLRGVRALEKLAELYGAAEIEEQLAALTGQAQMSFRETLRAKPLVSETAEEKLDDGTVIRVRAIREGDRLTLDFAGTSESHPGNLNATPAIVRSAILYCLRLWTGANLPLNEGFLDDVELRVPVCFLNPAFPADVSQCPAVVGGNVETSQRLVDTVLKLFGVQACSQGTMNNFIFGNERFGYYETIAGGAGAGPGYDGASALHVHMTNTAITDPEILEARYPIRLRQFSVRRGSGGEGRFRGGDGVIREFEFLEPLSVSLLSQHRAVPPYGMEGGGPGSVGRQVLVRADGEVEEMAGQAAFAVCAGDRFVLETPGGGGWGSA